MSLLLLLVLVVCSIFISQVVAASPKSKHSNEKEIDRDELSDAEIGMMELSKTMKNPKALAEALEALKDPEIAKEVAMMMKDPQFKADMKKLTDDPSFKESVKKAQDSVETLSADPVRLKQLEAEIFAK